MGHLLTARVRSINEWTGHRRLPHSGYAATPADRLVDSVGVNTHLWYDNSVYYNRYSDIIKPALIDMGIRHIRDGVRTGPGFGENGYFYTRVRELTAAGVRHTLTTSYNGAYSTETNWAQLPSVYQWCNGGIVAWTGVNEPDLYGPTGGGWPAATTAAQQNLWNVIQADATQVAAGVQVVSSSPTGSGPTTLGDQSPWCDVVDYHPYEGGRRPGQQVSSGLTQARAMGATEPVVWTECGYHHHLPATGHIPVSLLADGIYTPRMFLEYFRRGVYRSFSYELMDLWSSAGQDARFGWISNGGTPYLAYTATKNLLTVMADPGPAFTPAPLPHRVEGFAAAHTRSLLFGKRDGSHWLAIWRDVDVWNRTTKTDINVAAQPVTVDLAQPRQWSTFRPTTAATVDDEGYGRHIDLQISGEAVLVKVA